MTASVAAAPAAHRGRVRRAPVPVALGLVSLLLVTGGFAFGVRLPNLHNGLIAATFTAVGVFVLDRRPGNREAWLFVATGLAHAVMFFGRQYGFAASDGNALPAASWLQWLGVWPLALVLVLVGATFMCFPDGRLPSPRWRFVMVAMAADGVLLALASALWPVEYSDNALSLGHPLDVGGYDTAQQVWNVAGPVSYLLFQVAWAAAISVRLRRADGDEARQLRWFVYAVALNAAAVLGSALAFGTPTLGLLTVPVVAFAAGAAIIKYRLYLRQISVQAAELRAAARRIVAAQDEARARIERDLHDGAQQRLVTLAMSLQSLAQRVASTGDDALAGQVEQARDQLAQALAELRDLARGIHPAVLTQAGLEAAVRFLAERAPLPVRVGLQMDRRLAQDVEATAYFVVSEALTNAAKHAQASQIAVTGGIRDGQLWIEISDDGRGGADGRRGSGLQGLVDRLATLGGHLTVTSPAGGGTRLQAVIPCA